VFIRLRGQLPELRLRNLVDVPVHADLLADAEELRPGLVLLTVLIDVPQFVECLRGVVYRRLRRVELGRQLRNSCPVQDDQSFDDSERTSAVFPPETSI
jgi:hypothetical protein